MAHGQLSGLWIDLGQGAAIEIQADRDLSNPTVYFSSDFPDRNAHKRGRKLLDDLFEKLSVQSGWNPLRRLGRFGGGLSDVSCA
jgi:hypothetical protein